MIRVEFLPPYDSSDPGLDGVSVTFPLRVSEGQTGTPPGTTDHRVTVTISGTLMSMWGFDRAQRQTNSPLVRTLFAFAWREVQKRLLEGPLPDHVKVPLRTDTAPKRNPFDPATLPDPDGFTATIERPPHPSTVEAVVGEDGTVTIRGLPFEPGARLDIVVRRHRAPAAREERPPQRAPVIRFDDPFGSVAEDDWDALK